MYVLLFLYIIVYSREEKVDNSKCELVDRRSSRYLNTFSYLYIDALHHSKNHNIAEYILYNVHLSSVTGILTVKLNTIRLGKTRYVRLVNKI